ncbi:glycosyltransferase involved in cell wall biosynthesis [Natronocella acetinitrilica]|uniref:Glycosyltransferase involved in cell wall biosynthesis n=1 Tax=Natronocella acetinitrilica TaxID=414046 RepID=A0AAE3G138_9GAMM|nr:glycosyltransferase involved in cell wall biosynthesis [Natronocella acetinitrilica]
MKIVIVTDAWHPQVNGVVTTLTSLARVLRQTGHAVRFITPSDFVSLPCPTYPDIRLALGPRVRVGKMLAETSADAIHIATEGPLGWAARAYCLAHGLRFTTAYHTRFPQYLRLRAPVPISWSYALLRRFHAPATRTLVATPSLRDELAKRGFAHLALWSRGVDSGLFRPRCKGFLDGPRPISMYVGRVAVEKNIEAFLDLNIPGTCYVVGDGPDAARLKARYPNVRFTGFCSGEDLARHVAAADCVVFPSRTDTFGLTMLEAMACGVPVAAYPVTGPRDVITDGVTGALDEDLGRAWHRAVSVSPDNCIAYARTRSWDACAQQFLNNLADPIRQSNTA